MIDAVLVECGLNWAELLQDLQLGERLPRRSQIMREKTNALQERLTHDFTFDALDALGAWTVRGPLERLAELLAGSEFRVVPTMNFETKAG